MKLVLREVALPMRRVFRIAHGATVVQTNLIVELQDGAFSGYGEGASLDYYGITARGGTQGVGRATTQAVVASSVLILVTDFFLTKLLISVFSYR